MEEPIANRTARAYLGTGWSFPPTFSRLDASVVMVSNDEDIRQSLWILFSTSLGERIMLPEYGVGLRRMVFQSITTSLKTEIRNLIRKAILSWEPRIDVNEITVQAEGHVHGLLEILVDYTIRGTNARNNLVYPFYLEEGTTPVQGP